MSESSYSTISEPTLLEYAEYYQQCGFNVIPLIPESKKPLIKWEKYQTEEVIPEQVTEWFEGKTPDDVGIGIVCGSVSGNLVVLDFDDMDRWEEFDTEYFENETIIVESGSGKRHVYLRSKRPVRKTSIREIGLDIQGNGSYVVAPPSIHPVSKQPYKFLDIHKPILEVDDALDVAWTMAGDLGFIRPSNVEKPDVHIAKIQSPLTEIRPCVQAMIDTTHPTAIDPEDGDTYHEARFVIASEGFAVGMDDRTTSQLFEKQRDYDPTTSEYMVQSLRKDNKGYWGCKAIREHGWCLGDSCKYYPNYGTNAERRGRPSNAKKILDLVEQKQAFSFIDQNRRGYLRFKEGSVSKHYPLESKYVTSWLSYLLYVEYGSVPKRQAIKDAVGVLYAQAQDRQYTLHNRVASDGEGGIWIDLCDDEWRAIHITDEGWEVINDPPILFRRYETQKPLPIPEEGGRVQDLVELTTIADPLQRLLFIIHTLSFWIPNIPHPIMNGYGLHGSAKTSSQRAAKAHIDPATLDTLTLTNDVKMMMQQLDHTYFILYDNVSNITETQSDDFCRAVTGAGILKRALYTDDDVFVRNYRRCIALNGIEINATRGDLLDRCILYEHRTPSEEERITEADFNKRLAESTPKTISAMLDVLVEALRKHKTIRLDRKPRMADFAEWGCAICEALGFPQDVFLDAYENARQENSEQAIESNIETQLLVQYLTDYFDRRVGRKLAPIWVGTATKLYTELQTYAEANHIVLSYSGFPKNATVYSRSLTRYFPDLEKMGIRVTRSGGTTRKIVIERTDEYALRDTEAIRSAVQQWLDEDDRCDGYKPSPHTKPQENSGEEDEEYTGVIHTKSPVYLSHPSQTTLDE